MKSIKNFRVLYAIYLFISVVVSNLNAQSNYQINVSDVQFEVKNNHLDLGGKGLNDESIKVNNFYISRNEKPIIPVIGEFHYCRYPHQYWDEQIKMIKAGGVNVIATYVFWNIHEPKEGEFVWKDDLNLRHFIELCKSNKIDVIVRIGPFDHGEIRNGGLPDWIYGRPFEVRSNDNEFLSLTKKLYLEIGKQLHGLYFKDGGPILGIQIENEYQHSAAPWAITYMGADKELTTANRDRKIAKDGVSVNDLGNDFAGYGQLYMQNLKTYAKEAGMEVPIYTATGWGFASIIENGSIPVMAGYAYPYWEESSKPSPFYLFKNIHKFPDYSPVSYNAQDYPSIAAELGTGMCNIYTRRPRVPHESFLPLMTRTIGSGSNGLGFYMYHGGTTPSNGFYFYTEGFGLNYKSYDYQSPIREFGNPDSGYFDLRIINTFLNNFGEELAPLYPVLPESNKSITPTDINTLRYAVRSDGDKGFLFMVNFQDHVKNVDLNNIAIHVKTKSGEISFPGKGTFTLPAGASAIFPFGIEFGSIRFAEATVQPYCKFINGTENFYIFSSIKGIPPEVVINGKVSVKSSGVKVISESGNTIIRGTNNSVSEFIHGKDHYLIIPLEKAKYSSVIGVEGNQYLITYKGALLSNGKNLDIISIGKEKWNFDIYPSAISFIADNVQLKQAINKSKLFSNWEISTEKVFPDIKLTKFDDRHYILNGKGLDLSKISDVYIKFNYRGDRAVCMLNGEMVTDNFYASQPWTIGLKRYAELLHSKEMYFYFLPMKKGAPYIDYLDKEVIPDFGSSNEFLEINPPEIIPEYRTRIEIK